MAYVLTALLVFLLISRTARNAYARRKEEKSKESA